MPPDGEKLSGAARALRDARSARKSIPRISETFGIADVDEAYEVAEINTRSRVDEGHRIVGMKIGLTSDAVQRQLGVDQPDFGILFEDMQYLNGESVDADSLIQPRIEAEVAFVVGRDLMVSEPTYGEFLRSLEYALPALEIVDSAIDDWKLTIVDTVADNASSGVFVLGDQPVMIGQGGFGDLGMQLTVNGRVVSSGSGAACFGHPLRAAYWLARTMTRRGQGLAAGQVILSGALGPMVSVRAGDLIHADMAALGHVSCSVK